MCRLCLEDEETSFHIVAECPALASIRVPALGSAILLQPLTWSPQLAMFVRGQAIGSLFDLDYPDEAQAEAGEVREEE